jgi:UDP-3-O-[3-hydroxymyristoyl] glucosamine N-acyltransferase
MKLPVFFKKEKSIPINKLFPKVKSNIKINDVATLSKSKKFDLTFFDSIRYKSFAINTKASFCIPTEKLEKFLPIHTQKIICKKVLFELAKVLKFFIPQLI